jgi:hypothetical protein
MIFGRSDIYADRLGLKIENRKLLIVNLGDSGSTAPRRIHVIRATLEKFTGPEARWSLDFPIGVGSFRAATAPASRGM